MLSTSEGASSHLSPPQIARALQVSTATLTRWRATGLGPPWIRAGRQIRYPVHSYNTWVQRQHGTAA
ncbi:hypothetical protein Ae168Ps1_6415c [Pseudonocardia sp. Ae168_Ps1]|uniref:helix-turn-helix domain-containing protein n=1 Tax=unclassified Pseudonocardia TaxID=2619320 RepID=UPI00094B23D8|nr:hypothetical protein Ae150APs1_6268c [Pseudonocardia sp. Ae150A_Ps1]OLL69990.1 hypothetical protein Ae168Ps1_6415c [Pseudonocardia sp. Ae168_Ps1]OLL89115.1 hypothetical protein Ae356Ps1_6231c [Pseudonocardia sp. Ae356_Ps1]